MTEGYFSIKRDNDLIAAGTHSWCQACVVAQPLVEQSGDPRYCQGCFKVLEAEAEVFTGRKKPTWVSRGADKDRKATDNAPGKRELVAKLPHHGKPPITEKQGIMQQPGRPRKQGEVHRATRWRRQKKAEQGVLV